MGRKRPDGPDQVVKGPGKKTRKQKAPELPRRFQAEAKKGETERDHLCRRDVDFRLTRGSKIHVDGKPPSSVKYNLINLEPSGGVAGAGGGGNRAIPVCSAHQVYYQSPHTRDPVCDQLLTIAQGHSALELPLITSYFGHSGAVVHGTTTSE